MILWNINKFIIKLKLTNTKLVQANNLSVKNTIAEKPSVLNLIHFNGNNKNLVKLIFLCFQYYYYLQTNLKKLFKPSPTADISSAVSRRPLHIMFS